jgi:hypothetical protein
MRNMSFVNWLVTPHVLVEIFQRTVSTEAKVYTETSLYIQVDYKMSQSKDKDLKALAC